MYRFRQSVAKYELMAVDVARVVYDKNKKAKNVTPDSESIELNKKSLEKLRKKQEKDQWQKMKLSDLNSIT